MKVCLVAQLSFILFFGLSVASDVSTERNTMQKVVKMLQDMLENSEEDGTVDDEAFEKYKCYCKHSIQEKEETIVAVKEQVEQLGNSIDELRGSNGNLVQQLTDVKSQMDVNAAQRAEASAFRGKENTLFTQVESELTAAITQMDQALDMLKMFADDQSLAVKQTQHSKFLASKAVLAKVASSVKEALVAADAYMTPEDRSKVTGLLQENSFSSMSNANPILDVLKKMKETFQGNLVNAKENERSAVSSFEEVHGTKNGAFQALEASYNQKQAQLSADDNDLAAKRSQLEAGQQQSEDDSAFLERLRATCESKDKEYDERKLFRSNEQAAISKAIAILSETDAQSTFRNVQATNIGALEPSAVSFLQESESTDVMDSVEKSLLEAARKQSSQKLAHVAVLLRSVQVPVYHAKPDWTTIGNPFTPVFEEIDKMIKVNDEEAAHDAQQVTWCQSEREENAKAMQERADEVSELETQRLNIKATIEDPSSGLLAEIATTETNLAQNADDQAKEKQNRKDEEVAYAVNVKEINNAQALINKAIEVLGQYYHSVNEQSRSLVIATGVGLAQVKSKQEPEELTLAAPASQEGQGRSVLNMLEFVFNETRREAATAAATEQQAQEDYKAMMDGLQSSEADLQKGLADLESSLAEKQKQLETTNEDLATTRKGEEMLKHYVESIKGGCDFIIANKDLRDTNRAQEKQSLEQAKNSLLASPAYNTAVQAEKYGSCWRQCQDDESDIHCVACRAGHTTQFLCHKWPGTPGCETVTTRPHQWETTTAGPTATAR